MSGTEPRCAPRTQARSSRPARATAGPYDRTTARGPCRRYGRARRRGPARPGVRLQVGHRGPGARMTCMNRRTFLGAALAAPVAIGLDPMRVLGATTGGAVVALVTADLESHVVALETASGQIVKRIRTVEAPRSIESSPFGHVVVAHTPIGALSVLDAATLTVRAVVRGLGE